jgi:uncharacterized membrane protein YkvA (DUF1232 family)
MVAPGAATVKAQTAASKAERKSTSMRPKAKSTASCLTSNKPNTAHFGQVSPNLWKINGRTITIDQYIEDRRRDVNAAEICVLQAFTNRLRDKLKEVNPSEYLELREMVHLLVRTLESTAVEYMVDPLPNWLAAVGFASSYLLERYDLIPDHLPGIGLADDILILQRVIARNRSDLHLILREDNGAGSDEDDPHLP